MANACGVDLRIQRPWLYYKSGVDFLHDFWPISPTKPELVEDHLYGPGYVQRMMERFALIAAKSKYGAPTPCGRSGFQARRIRSYEEQTSRTNGGDASMMATAAARRHPSCPLAEVDPLSADRRASTPASVKELKRKFEQLCSLGSANSLVCNNTSSSGRGTLYRRTPTPCRRVCASPLSPVSSPDRTPDVFVDPSPPLFVEEEEDVNHKWSSISKSCSPPPRKRLFNSGGSSNSAKAPTTSNMTTAAVNVDQSNTGLMEMNRLLEKFRQNREHRMRNQTGADEKPLSNGTCQSSVVVVAAKKTAPPPVSPELRRPIQPAALRPSPRPSLSAADKGNRRNRLNNNNNNGLSEIDGIGQVGCVVASYVSGPEEHPTTDNSIHFQASVSLSDSDSDCSSYDPEECQKKYQFDNAYIVPIKSNMNTAKGAALKNNYVVFSNEPPLAYVYLEESEAQITGQWQAGEDVTMESYFSIKEQMREERNKALENGIH